MNNDCGYKPYDVDSFHLCSYPGGPEAVIHIGDEVWDSFTRSIVHVERIVRSDNCICPGIYVSGRDCEADDGGRNPWDISVVEDWMREYKDDGRS